MPRRRNVSEQTFSVEEHLRKARAYADCIRSICNLAAEESAPGFEDAYEVLDWVFVAVRALDKHLLLVKRTLPAQCLNLPVLGPETVAEDAGSR
jgi:hypothetical protein